MHILFTDDNQDTRDLFSMIFQMANHRVCLASDGFEAVAEVEKQLFDAIVLDLQMPGMDGWEALERIRELPKGTSVPVAMFSGSLDYDQLDYVLQRGADAIFHKPLLPNTMLFLLEELVQRGRSVSAS